VSAYEDRQIVAGILLKRLDRGMKLDVDATVQYAVALRKYCESVGRLPNCSPTVDELAAMNWWPKDLTATDLNYDSLFNTRIYAGLPPEPICNPSTSAIKAVLNFTESPYFFYLHDIEATTHYSTTLEQHNVNIQKYILD